MAWHPLSSTTASTARRLTHGLKGLLKDPDHQQVTRPLSRLPGGQADRCLLCRHQGDLHAQTGEAGCEVRLGGGSGSATASHLNAC